MNIDALSRILDRHFKDRVWRVAIESRDGFVPLAGCYVQPHPGQTVPAEADVLAWEADDAAAYAASSNPDTIKTRAATAALDLDAMRKTFVDWMTDHEHRLRALQGLSTITDAQVKTAAINRYKSHLP